MPGGLLSKLFGGKSIVNDIANVADRFIHTKEEKNAFRARMIELEQKYEQIAQSNVTKRHELDMSSDSWLSKNIRPLTLGFLIIMVTILAFTDGNVGSFTIQESYIMLYEKLLLTVFAFYFVGRGISQTIERHNRTKKD